jgi:glyoxylate utilization-related uncharacterized protein
MKQVLIASVALLMISASSVLADQMVTVQPDGMKWGDGPPTLPKGMQLAVLVGDPGLAGPYVIRIKVPAGYQIPAHWHSTAENLTVLAGVVNVGMGDKLDKSEGHALDVGGFAFLPAKMGHFLWTTSPATFQIHADGPFDIHYVNVNDRPPK